MNYGYIDKDQIRKKAVAICDCIGHGKYNTAVEQEVKDESTDSIL